MDTLLSIFKNHIVPFSLFQQFAGNTDEDTVVYHELNPRIRARFIRFRPEDWNNAISMRVELYGCHEGRKIRIIIFLVSIIIPCRVRELDGPSCGRILAIS